jgi:hypothetical protein
MNDYKVNIQGSIFSDRLLITNSMNYYEHVLIEDVDLLIEQRLIQKQYEWNERMKSGKRDEEAETNQNYL